MGSEGAAFWLGVIVTLLIGVIGWRGPSATMNEIGYALDVCANNRGLVAMRPVSVFGGAGKARCMNGAEFSISHEVNQ